MRSSTKFLAAAAATMVIASTVTVPAMAGPTGRVIVLPKGPPNTTRQRLFAAKCWIKRSHEFPEAMAIAPVTLPAGAVTLVTLLGDDNAEQTGLTLTSPVAKGAQFIAALDVGQARSCNALIIR